MLLSTPSRRPVLRLVELVGPPGAGKSTLARAALAAARASGSIWVDARLLARRPRLRAPSDRALAIASRRRGLATLLLGAPDEAVIAEALDAAAPVLGPLLARAGRGPATDDAVLRGLGVRWALDALAVRALVDAARRDRPAGTVALLDEGLTHPYKLAALDAAPTPPPDILALVPLPDVLVRVEVPDDVLTARLRRRRDATPAAPRERSWAGEAGLAAEVERLRTTTDAVVAVATRRGIPVLTIDGTASPQGAAEDLVARVDGLLRSTA